VALKKRVTLKICYLVYCFGTIHLWNRRVRHAHRWAEWCAWRTLRPGGQSRI